MVARPACLDPSLARPRGPLLSTVEQLRWTSALLMAAIALAAVGGGAWWWKQRQDAAAAATAGGAATGPNAARRAGGGPGRFGGGNVQPVSVGTVQRAMCGWW